MLYSKFQYCNGWDGNPRRQRAPSRWADQGISRALVQSQSCKMRGMWKNGFGLLLKLYERKTRLVKPDPMPEPDPSPTRQEP